MKKYLLICIYCLFIIAGNAQESPQDSLLRQQQTEKELKKQKKAKEKFGIIPNNCVSACDGTSHCPYAPQQK